MVTTKLEAVPTWREAKKDICLLRRLVLQEAGTMDESYQYYRRQKRKREQESAEKKGAANAADVSSSARKQQGKRTGPRNNPPERKSGTPAAKTQATGKTTTEKRTCYNCGKPGHIGKNCPQSRGHGEDAIICYGCGERGHRRPDCPSSAAARKSAAPKPSPKIGRVAATALRATTDRVVVGGKVPVPFVWDNGADVSCFPGSHFKAAHAAGAFRAVDHLVEPTLLTMGNGTPARVTHRDGRSAVAH